ncbi:hypothetical protein [Cryobacterium sp. Y57]|uniref:hypothetical protein n=1 Tax=Cryobacterium sp. Y57 TaxID=2048287 RepID=UPI0011B0AAF2|nr:hypothetical protein [Cryobacterium sp. Y57]
MIGIYIETIDNETANEMSGVCQIGGTVGAPEWASYGVGSRTSDRDFFVSSRTNGHDFGQYGHPQRGVLALTTGTGPQPDDVFTA